MVSGPAAIDADGNVTVTGTGEVVIQATKTGDGYNDATAQITFTASSRPSSGGDSAPTYRPDVTEPDNGTVSVIPRNPERGDTVTITPEPEDGYEVDQVTVTDRNGSEVAVTKNEDGTLSFRQPSGRVTVTVTFREIGTAENCPQDESCPMYGFTDLDMAAWYHDGVHYCLENGLMAGTSGSTFNPEGVTTRGQIVTILWRLAGSPQVDYLMDFSDVSEDAYYGEAIRWAASEGIVGGYGAGLFGPNDPITRE